MVAVPVPAVQPVVPALLIVTGVAVVPAVVSAKGGVLVVVAAVRVLHLPGGQGAPGRTAPLTEGRGGQLEDAPGGGGVGRKVTVETGEGGTLKIDLILLYIYALSKLLLEP